MDPKLDPKLDPKRWPTEIRLAKDKRSLRVAFDDGSAFELAAEYLRVTSPSAEVQGHSPAERKTVPGTTSAGPTTSPTLAPRACRGSRPGASRKRPTAKSATDREGGLQLPTGRFASVRPIPSAIIAAPDALRRRRMSDGRAAAPSRMPPAAKATTMSASVLSATDTKPSTTNCSATSPRAGSTNCGMKARKKAAVFGFSAS